MFVQHPFTSYVARKFTKADLLSREVKVIYNNSLFQLRVRLEAGHKPMSLFIVTLNWPTCSHVGNVKRSTIEGVGRCASEVESLYIILNAWIVKPTYGIIGPIKNRYWIFNRIPKLIYKS